MKNALKCLFILLLPALLSAQKKAPLPLQRKIDSIQVVISKDKEDTLKVHHLNILAKYYQVISQFDTSLVVCKRALALAQKLGYKKGLANSYNIMGNQLASQGIFPEALKDHLASLRIAEEIEDKQGEASSYNNIGIIYKEIGNFKEALRYQEMALKIRKDIGDKQGLAPSYNNIGNIYFLQKNFEEALENYSASLALKKELNDKKGISASYNNLGSVYFEQKKFKEAHESYLASVKIKEEIGDLKGLATSYVNLASTFSMLKKHADAKAYAHKAIDLAQKLGSYPDLESGYLTLSDLEKQEGNYKLAYEHFRIYKLYLDTVLSEENSQKNVRAQMQYDFDKKEAVTRAEQEKKDVIAAGELKQKATELDQQIKQRNYFIAGFVLVFLLIVFILRSFFQNKKANKLLNEKNILIERQKLVVEEKQKEILDSIIYARRIQRTLITSEKYMETKLKQLKASTHGK